MLCMCSSVFLCAWFFRQYNTEMLIRYRFQRVYAYCDTSSPVLEQPYVHLWKFSISIFLPRGSYRWTRFANNANSNIPAARCNWTGVSSSGRCEDHHFPVVEMRRRYHSFQRQMFPARWTSIGVDCNACQSVSCSLLSIFGQWHSVTAKRRNVALVVGANANGTCLSVSGALAAVCNWTGADNSPKA